MLLRIRYCKVVLRKFSEPSSSFTQWYFVAAWMKAMFVREISLWKNSSLIWYQWMLRIFSAAGKLTSSMSCLFCYVYRWIDPLASSEPIEVSMPQPLFFHLIFTPSVMNMILQLMSFFLSYDLDCCLFLDLGLRLLFQTFGPSKFLIE